MDNIGSAHASGEPIDNVSILEFVTLSVSGVFAGVRGYPLANRGGDWQKGAAAWAAEGWGVARGSVTWTRSIRRGAQLKRRSADTCFWCRTLTSRPIVLRRGFQEGDRWTVIEVLRATVE
ncbi:hypothetical protein KM043_014624 [Ampulex compressa]|nr:hypothetical protein KM043_014624 [Ampulex compressa]